MSERTFTSTELRRWLGVYDSDIDRFRREGLLPGATKEGVRWRYPESAVVALAEQQDRLSAVLRKYRHPDKALTARIAELEADLAKVRQATLRDLAAMARPEELFEVVDALYQAEPRGWRLRERAKSDLDKAQLAEMGMPSRPRTANPKAQRRFVATAIGRVDVWLWQTPKGWMGIVGGPRPLPRTRSASHQSLLHELARLARYQYGKPVRRVSLKRRFAILQRDGFACHYCGRKAPEVELHVDHVRPASDEASNDEANLVAACAECNMGKSGG